MKGVWCIKNIFFFLICDSQHDESIIMFIMLFDVVRSIKKEEKKMGTVYMQVNMEAV